MNFDQKELYSLKPAELDDYLAHGWFRMHQSVFTTDAIWFNKILYKVIWLRVYLKLFQPDNSYMKLKKLNKNFVVRITDAEINYANEELFTLYKSQINFEAALNLEWLLSGYRIDSVFNTKMISVFDNGLLIGTGFFDLGEKSAAGISSFYHPAYKKYSLGKFIIYEKLNYCYKQNLLYFYPGYVVPGYTAFDYKLSIAKNDLEYFDSNSCSWKNIPINTENKKASHF